MAFQDRRLCGCAQFGWERSKVTERGADGLPLRLNLLLATDDDLVNDLVSARHLGPMSVLQG